MGYLPVAATAALLLVPAACSSDGGLPAVEGPTAPKLELDGSEFRYAPSKIAVAAGDVEVVLHNVGAVIHDLRIEGMPSLIVEAGPGATATATWTLPEGRYEMYCSIPGHRAAGMVGVLEVR